MSIIHDALKKVQQGLSNNGNDTPQAAAEEKKTNSGYVYASASEPLKTAPMKERPVEKLGGSIKKKFKSLLAMLCAILLTTACIAVLVHQINVYFPDLFTSVKSSYYQLIHKEEVVDVKTPKVLVPLAKIVVLPPAPKPTITAVSATVTSPTATAAIPTPPVENKPQTLNIHGVMSNGSQNVVLIDDQVYQEGDEVDGIKILKINLDSITILNNGQEQKIKVKG